ATRPPSPAGQRRPGRGARCWCEPWPLPSAVPAGVGVSNRAPAARLGQQESSRRRDRMGDANWNEVAERFQELGQELQRAWKDGDRNASDPSEMDDAGDKVRVALDGLAEAINHTAPSPSVHLATRRATSSVAEALAGSLQELAEWIDRSTTR